MDLRAAIRSGLFDIIAFSMGYEMAYTNVLNMLDLSGLPMESSEREALSPLVMAGGTCCYNPEPLAGFVDLFLIGEGETLNSEVIALYRAAKKKASAKKNFCRRRPKFPVSTFRVCTTSLIMRTEPLRPSRRMTARRRR
jgi:radical SAM superfamily enzyme YgiQ (UPF0313 family)